MYRRRLYSTSLRTPASVPKPFGSSCLAPPANKHRKTLNKGEQRLLLIKITKFTGNQQFRWTKVTSLLLCCLGSRSPSHLWNPPSLPVTWWVQSSTEKIECKDYDWTTRLLALKLQTNLFAVFWVKLENSSSASALQRIFIKLLLNPLEIWAFTMAA